MEKGYFPGYSLTPGYFENLFNLPENATTFYRRQAMNRNAFGQESYGLTPYDYTRNGFANRFQANTFPANNSSMFNFWNQPSQNYGFDINTPSFYIPNNLREQKYNNTPRYWDTAADGKRTFDYVKKNEGNIFPIEQNLLDYVSSLFSGVFKTGYNYIALRNKPYTDKYKHAFINCKSAQSGQGGYDAVKYISDLKERKDIKSGTNTIDSSKSDDYANRIGRLLGSKYPEGDCDELVKTYINKNW